MATWGHCPTEGIVNPDLGLMIRLLDGFKYRNSLSSARMCFMGSGWLMKTELKVIHYALGPLKPWNWWTAWLAKHVGVWQNVRVKLEESLPGSGGGRNPNRQLLLKLLVVIPTCALLLCYRRSCIQFSNGTHSKLHAYLSAASVVFCFIAATISEVQFAVVPRQVMPWTGLLLMYEWTFTAFFIIFGSYLRLLYHRGKTTSNQAGTMLTCVDFSVYDSGKGFLRFKSAASAYKYLYEPLRIVLEVY
ncbi:inositol phosphorylceramide glucuronosyltransferase 1-like [Elaeis guineensis]|uniref:inositol phosphorylceramide glucuronosyltransferase 1-like n=1 Tax=Elaeis guineensis var. tenera TaxID=51953 RepID=UPI003C6CCEFE